MWQGDWAAPPASCEVVGDRHANIYAAPVATADRAEIGAVLTTDPARATRKGGPLDWMPCSNLAYARSPTNGGLDAAQLLLDTAPIPRRAG